MLTRLFALARITFDCEKDIERSQMIDSSWYFPVIVVVASVLAVGMGFYAVWSAKRSGEKIDAIRKEKADIERELRNLKPHLQ